MRILLLLALAFTATPALNADNKVLFGKGGGQGQASPTTYSVVADGVNEYMESGTTGLYTFPANQSWSISVFIKFASLDRAAFFEKISGSKGIGVVQYGSGKVNLDLVVSGINYRRGITTNSNVVTTGTWYRLLFCYNGAVNTNISIFKDGASQAVTQTTTGTFTTGSDIVVANPVRILRDTDDSLYSNARVDEVSVWDANLCNTQSDVDALYVGTKSANLLYHPKAANLKHWWRMGNSPGDAYPTLVDVKGGPSLTMINMEAGDITADYPRKDRVDWKSLWCKHTAKESVRKVSFVPRHVREECEVH